MKNKQTFITERLKTIDENVYYDPAELNSNWGVEGKRNNNVS